MGMSLWRLLPASLPAFVVLSCSVTNDLDGLTDNVGGSAGAEAGVDAAAACGPGDCSGCVGCQKFCECATTTAAALDQCLKTSCTSDAGKDGTAGSGGTSGTEGGTDGSTGGAGGSNGGGLFSPACIACASSNCSGQKDACENDAQCNAILSCYAACSDAACESQCVNNNPNGQTDFSAYLGCLKSSCSFQCSG